MATKRLKRKRPFDVEATMAAIGDDDMTPQPDTVRYGLDPDNLRQAVAMPNFESNGDGRGPIDAIYG